ncbi:MAG: DUF4388 domain-containing protein [Chitinispirillaceae bacterium]|nr:DUF4388 domain-containing protein [Chitinispirillaceae bacterium]
MVLSGTLREFILADVMQLLTQQKITGKLILVNGSSEGHIVFKNGTVVSAVREQEQFSTKLFNFLTEMRQQPKNKVREVFSSYEGNLAGLTSFIEKKELLSHDELENYAVNVTIDITCSLFLWNRGNYRFDSMPSVDHLIPAGIEIPVENVVMEAMRRIDEWHRMREAITEETIFTLTGKSIDLETDRDPISDPSPYFYHRIDGTTDTKKLLADSFLTEYKIYETLYQMMQDDLIHPLSDTITRSIRAAILKKEQSKSVATVFPPIIAISVSLGIILLILLLAFFLRGVLFSKLSEESSLLRNEITRQQAVGHLHEAELFYRSTSITPPYPGEQPPVFFSVTGKEAKYFSQKRDLD